MPRAVGVRQNDRRAPIFGVRQNNRRALPDARAAKYAPAPKVRACGVFMAEKAPLLPRSLIYRKFSYSRPFLFAFLRKILYTISVNRLRESLNGTSSAIEGRPRFARELINMRESPNGMASASQADSRGFDSRLSLQAKRTGTAPVLFALQNIFKPSSNHFFPTIFKTFHSANNFFISVKPFSIKTPVCLALSSS